MNEGNVVDASYQRLLFRTAILVMACDGEIHADEVRELKLAAKSTRYFSGLEFENEMALIRDQLRDDKVGTLREHFRQLSAQSLNPAAALHMLELVLRIVYADQRVHENEIRFCQLLQQILHVPEPVIEKRFGSVPFLVAQSTSEKSPKPGSAMDFAGEVAIPKQEDFNQIGDT